LIYSDFIATDNLANVFGSIRISTMGCCQKYIARDC